MSNQIQINQKLMEREDCLTEIFDLERRINSILGGEPYPLAPPAALPSLQKRRKAQRLGKPTAAAPLRVRKLDPETEKAYRITYRQNDTEYCEIHTDARPLALLLNTPLPDTEIRRIETGNPIETGEWESVEVLFGA
jgi:hypothetical protein